MILGEVVVHNAPETFIHHSRIEQQVVPFSVNRDGAVDCARRRRGRRSAWMCIDELFDLRARSLPLCLCRAARRVSL
jgi:hypothetical protein